jgi:hypothetical protein
VAQVGLGEANVTVPIINASFREVDILGVRAYLYCTPLAIDLVSSGKSYLTAFILIHNSKIKMYKKNIKNHLIYYAVIR